MVKTNPKTTYDQSIRAVANDALKHVKKNYIVGLGSGRAAAALVQSLAKINKKDNLHITGIPTSLQIKIIARTCGIPTTEADQIDYIDVVFDGADQIDSNKFVIKGGGGALLRENILFSLAKKVIVMADETKFANVLYRKVPVEVHPLATTAVKSTITDIGGTPILRTQDNSYPFFTENGNVILDCDFGNITDPPSLTQKIKSIPGVLESGIFLKRPDIIYKAKPNRKFSII